MVFLLCLFVCCFGEVKASTETTKRFDLPEGRAIETLRQAALQGEIQILFSDAVVDGVVTKAIHGDFSPREALAFMLKGTGLGIAQANKNGAYAITPAESKAEVGRSNDTTTTTQPNSETKTDTEMNANKNNWLKTLATVLTIGLAGGAEPLSAQENEEAVYELSPFTVESSDDQGYLATSTLAGTRLKSNLRDVASSISIVTKEFMEDTGSTDVNELLVYTSNTEAFGAGGNFSNDNGSQSADTAQERAEPQRSTRVRGLDPADLTRNYYLTDIAFDSYNTERVSINRGANNILFGLGSPSGIINQQTIQATISEDFGDIKVRFDDEGSTRASLDYNKVVNDKLAFRIAALNDSREYKQEPAFDDDERFFVAMTAKLWKGATLRANFETGDGSANRPNPVAPPEAISSWFRTQEFAGPDAQKIIWDGWSDQVLGSGSRAQWNPGQFSLPLTMDDIMNGIPTLPRVVTSSGRFEDGNIHATRGALAYWADPNSQFPDSGSENRIRRNFMTPDDPRTPEFDPANPGSQAGFGLFRDAPTRAEMRVVRNIGRVQRRIAERNAGDLDGLGLVLGEDVGLRFIDQGFTDTQVFDFTNNLISGGTSFQNTDFDAHNITLEQLFLDGKLGFELGFDKQDYMVDYFVPFRSSKNQQVFIDINTTLPSGIPNPNFGRPFVSAGNLTKTTRTTEREASRFTAFYNLDLADMLVDSLGDFWSQFVGNHTITAFYNEQTIDELTYDQGLKWGDTDFIRAINDGNLSRLQLNDSATNVQALIYLGDPVIDAPNFESVRVGRIGDNVQIWNPGGSVPNVRYWDPGPSPDDSRLPAANNSGLPLLDDEGNIQDFGEAAIIANGRLVERDVAMVAATLNALREKDDVESAALIMQSKFFSDNLVSTLGYREDTSSNYTNDSAVRLSDGTDELNGFRAEDGRFAEVSDETFSWSAVGHLPERWAQNLPFNSELSVHLGASENFQAEAGSVDRFLNPIAPPNGSTREAGVTISMFDRKFYARVNWFETSVSNSVADSFVDNGTRATLNKVAQWLDQATDLEDYANDSMWDDNPMGRQDMLDTVDIARKSATLLWENDAILPEAVKQNFGNPTATVGSDGSLTFLDTNALETPQGMSDTQDLTAEGVEFEIVYNPTSNWTMIANISKQDAKRANVAPRSEAFYNEFFPQSETAVPGWSGVTLANMPVSFFEGPGEAVRIYDSSLGAFIGRPDLGAINEGTGNFWFQNQRSVGDYPAFLTLKSSEGAPQPELREWRVNFVTNYKFSEGRLKGLGVGGGVRWQDEAAVGYPTIRITPEGGGDAINIGDIFNPYYDGTQTNYDFWLSYQVPIMDNKIDWKIQLNVQNVFADEDDVITTATNPNGAAARVRFAPQRSIFLSNTFKF